MNACDFERELLALDPDAVDFVIRVDELVASLPPDGHESMLPSIFKFFEEHPRSDVGVPGTLVHITEHFWPKYKPLLLSSLARAPSYCAVLMTNRILNSELSDSERAEYIRALRAVVESSDAHQEVRNAAQHFIEYQAARG